MDAELRLSIVPCIRLRTQRTDERHLKDVEKVEGVMWVFISQERGKYKLFSLSLSFFFFSSFLLIYSKYTHTQGDGGAS